MTVDEFDKKEFMSVKDHELLYDFIRKDRDATRELSRFFLLKLGEAEDKLFKYRFFFILFLATIAICIFFGLMIYKG